MTLKTNSVRMKCPTCNATAVGMPAHLGKYHKKCGAPGQTRKPGTPRSTAGRWVQG